MYTFETDLKHLSSVQYQGKLVLFGLNPQGSLQYAVKVEPSTSTESMQSPSIPWTHWQKVPLPQDTIDQSVINYETQQWSAPSHEDEKVLIRSLYASAQLTRRAPIQVLSTEKYIFLFRQSKSGKLLVDRFVLDAEANRLVRKLEVRYKRSRKKYEPIASGNGGQFDSRDFRDANGQFFYEPSRCLNLLNILHGRFSVVLVPTNEHDVYRWHIFTYNSTENKIQLISLRYDEDDIFNLNDYTVLEGDPQNPVARQIPGIIRRTLTFKDKHGLELIPVDAPSATSFSLQTEVSDENGETHLLKTAVRVMLTVPVGEKRQCGSIIFAVHKDGTLAQADETPQDTLIREENEEILLPLDLLYDVQSLKDGEPIEGSTEIARLALRFDGNGDTISIPSSVANNFGQDQEFTISVWVRATGTQQDTRNPDVAIIEKWSDGAVGYPFVIRYLHATGQIVGARYDGEQFASVTSQKRINDGKFHHIAFTKQGKELFLHIDGEKDAVAADTVVKNTQNKSPLYIGSRGGQLNFFTGDIAELHIWNRARTGDEIRELMTQRPLGQELNLSAYYPLNAIATGEVVDFSKANARGKVVGAYVVPRTFAKAQGYRNSRLYAVIGKATYQETFEYRTDQASEAFDFVFWGIDREHNETGPKVFEKAQITSLADGWKRAQARYTIPEKMTHLREFEITAPGGSWNTMEVRRHRVERLIDTLTIQEHDDRYELTVIGDGYANLHKLQQEITPLEQEHANLLVNIDRFEKEIAQLNGASATTLKTNLDTAINALETAKQAEVNAGKAYYREVGAYSNYYWQFQSNTSFAGRSLLNAIVQVNLSLLNSRWTVEEAGNGVYRLHSNSPFPGTNAWSFVPLSPIPPDTPPHGVHQIISKANNQALEMNEYLGIINASPNRDSSRQHWKFVALGRSTHKIEDANKAWEDAQKALAEAAAKEQTARNNLNNKAAELAKAQTNLDNAKKRLAEVESSLRGKQTSYMDVAKTLLNSLDMPLPKKDAYGLGVSGALLDFAIPQARINAYESYEGGVHLNFIDGDRRLRTCIFDAQAETWQINAPTTCLSFKGGKINVGKNLVLDAKSFTIEFWAKRQALNKGHFLISQGENKQNKGLYVGFRDTNRFTFAFHGDDLDTSVQADLDWHHWACVYNRKTHQSQIFRDGELLGSKTAGDYLGTGDLLIGSALDGGLAFQGQATDIRVWYIALTQEEIQSQMHQVLTGNEPGLAAYWKTNEANGSDLRDQTGNGNNGKIEGAITWLPSTAPLGIINTPSCLNFKGNGKVDCGNKISLPRSFSIEFWAKRQSLNRSDMIVFHGENQRNKGLHIGFRDSNRFIFAFYANDLETPTISDLNWHHWACVYDHTTNLRQIFQDGKLLVSDTSPVDFEGKGTFLLGSTVGGSHAFTGQLSHVRVWSRVLTVEEIQNQMYQRLAANEADLIACWSANEPASMSTPRRLTDQTGQHHGTMDESVTWIPSTAPLRSNTLLGIEYSQLEQDEVGNKIAMLRRMLIASRETGGYSVFPECRIEELELRWVGNAQFEPTLLGYIEGAPPIPSENLTIEPSYNGATAVELSMSEDVEFSWTRSQESGLGSQIDVGIGAWATISAGLVVESEAEGGALFKGRLGFNYNFLNETSIATSVGLGFSDRLELKGTLEREAAFAKANLGRRFIPKNVGYAVVVSALADVFILRLRKSRRMIGYQIAPVQDIPPDINTITFLINPAYILNGSLDGQVGSNPADERFFGHIPKMRSQYGSLYPASYYRLKEAYDLKQQIENQDKVREAFYINFNSHLVDETSLNRQVSTINMDADEDSKDNAEAIGDKELDQITSEQRQGEQKVTASDSYASWQQRMEDLLLQAGKRNIVNTYVWDGDGGLRSETQQFASSVSHTIGGSFNLDAGLGVKAAFRGFGAGFELEALATVNLTQTMTKTETRSKGFSLNVEIACENNDITDEKDYPLYPGEKVDRYRFMSFYLEPDVQNFNHFFQEVIDPEWLQSNDEEARTLRQINQTKPNKTWCVLHRVTYVERPALMGFGSQMGSGTDEDGTDTLREQVARLETKLDALLAALQRE